MAESAREQMYEGRTATDVRLDEIMVKIESDAALVGRWLTDTIDNPEYTTTETLCDQIDTGVALALIINKLFPNQNVKVTVNAQHGTSQARDNLANVLLACTALGIHESTLFAVDDLVQKRNICAVLCTLVSLKQIADKHMQHAGGKASDAEEKATTTETAVEEAHSVNVPAADALGEASTAEVPAERPPARQQPAETDETPVEGVPVEGAGVEEAAVEEAAVEEAPAKVAPAEEAPPKELYAEEAPVEEPVVEEAPAEEVHEENAHGEEAPAEEASAKEAHDGEAPVPQDASKHVPHHDELKNCTEAELIARINNLDVSTDVRNKITGIVSNSAGCSESLSYENISDNEALLIGEGLRRNDTLERLYLQDNKISDLGAAAICEGLSGNATLQTLHLQNNKISDLGAEAIGEVLSTNATLQTLVLNGNKISHGGYLALAKAFRWTTCITLLDANPKGAVYKTEDEINEIKEIGRGEFGSVRLAAIDGGTEIVEKKAHGGSNHDGIYERLMLQGLPEHRNIVRVAALSYDDTLLMEAHKGGSLKEYAKSQEDGTTLSTFLNYSHGMCLAIEHIHKYGVIHRDIALRNYVLTDDLETPVLVDFGLAWPLLEEKYAEIRSNEMMPFRQCAPEVLAALRYSKGADIWQLGLAMWQLLQRGRQPFFQVINARELLEYLHKKMVQENAHIPLPFKKNGAARVLISTIEHVVVFCCAYDPEKRPTATQVVREIESLRESVDGEPADGGPAEEKAAPIYEPSESNIESGLAAYNYTDYQNLKTDGQSDYIDLKKEHDEHDYGKLAALQEVDELQGD